MIDFLLSFLIGYCLNGRVSERICLIIGLGFGVFVGLATISNVYAAVSLNIFFVWFGFQSKILWFRG